MTQAQSQRVSRPWRQVAATTGRHRGAGVVPALEPRADGIAATIGSRLAHLHPALAFVVLGLGAYALLAAATTLVGLLFTRVLLTPGLEAADEGVVQWLAGLRTPGRTEISFFGSEVSGRIAIPVVVGLVAVAFAIVRQWLAASFAIFAVSLESASYRTTVQFVERERPEVQRLEELPVDASFPSGHTAAAIAVYSGFALLLTSRVGSTPVRVCVWAVALTLAVVVGISRMYRGMHHPLDLVAGLLMGISALALAVLVARATAVVAERRRMGERRNT